MFDAYFSWYLIGTMILYTDKIFCRNKKDPVKIQTSDTKFL